MYFFAATGIQISLKFGLALSKGVLPPILSVILCCLSWRPYLYLVLPDGHCLTLMLTSQHSINTFTLLFYNVNTSSGIVCIQLKAPPVGPGWVTGEKILSLFVFISGFSLYKQCVNTHESVF